MKICVCVKDYTGRMGNVPHFRTNNCKFSRASFPYSRTSVHETDCGQYLSTNINDKSEKPALGSSSVQPLDRVGRGGQGYHVNPQEFIAK
jgi:hypothetical protein